MITPDNINIDRQVTANGAGQQPPAETAPEQPATQAPDRFEQRWEPIEELYQSANTQANPWTKVMGMVAADLAGLELQIHETLQQALGKGRLDPQDLTQNREGIEMVLKFAKQLAMYAQIHRKLLKDSEQPTQPPVAAKQRSEESAV